MPHSFTDIKHELEPANDEAMRFSQSDHIELVDQLAQTYPLMLTQKDQQGKIPADLATPFIRTYLIKTYL